LTGGRFGPGATKNRNVSGSEENNNDDGEVVANVDNNTAVVKRETKIM
jgi:hypothetical protein